MPFYCNSLPEALFVGSVDQQSDEKISLSSKWDFAVMNGKRGVHFPVG